MSSKLLSLKVILSSSLTQENALQTIVEGYIKR